MLSTEQEEIVEDLDNELFLGLGKKNKEQKTGSAREKLNKIQWGGKRVGDVSKEDVIPEFELHTE